MTDDENTPENSQERARPDYFYEASEKNRWQKGQSGNPAGKPKGARNRATILKKYLGVVLRDKDGKTRGQPYGMDGDDPLTVEEAMEVAQLNKALKGDTNAYKEIKDTVYGKNPDIVLDLDDSPAPDKEAQELKGEALVEELKKRGLPSQILEE